MGSRPRERKCLPSGKFAPFPAKQAHSQFCSQSYKGPWRPAWKYSWSVRQTSFPNWPWKNKKTRPARNIEREKVQINQFGHEIKLLTHVVNYTRRLERLKKRSSAKTMKVMPLKKRSSLKNFESCDFCCGAVVVHARGQHTRVGTRPLALK